MSGAAAGEPGLQTEGEKARPPKARMVPVGERGGKRRTTEALLELLDQTHHILELAHARVQPHHGCHRVFRDLQGLVRIYCVVRDIVPASGARVAAVATASARAPSGVVPQERRPQHRRLREGGASLLVQWIERRA